ncbi:unnamed protein product [Allacma fusca]|uniref:HAT C-terminal dimerisation domain-containing protein n=1 Tax=Allacma fusca TaxID=39272 RepID=A0A8J2NT88_9HEXA|nr:unnamed protein product [Allacma fusca]
MSSQRIHPIVNIWSTRTNESVLGIKNQYLNDNFEMINQRIAFEEFTEDQTAESIQQKVREIRAINSECWPQGEGLFDTLTNNEGIAKIQDVFDKFCNNTGRSETVKASQSAIGFSKGLFSFLGELENPQVTTIRSELEKYVEKPTVAPFYVVNGEEVEVGVLQYWRENKFRFSTLFKMLKIYLSIPASSEDVERLFFIAGTLKRHHRNALSIKELYHILTIKYHHYKEKRLKR